MAESLDRPFERPFDRPVRVHAGPCGARLADSLERVAERRAAAEAEAAHRRGLEEGRRAALENGREALEALLTRLDAAAERAQEELAQTSVELAVEIARLLVGMRVEAGEYDLESIVRGALADSDVGRGACVVHLNPEDHERLAEVHFRSGTALEADPNLPRGDVHLSTPRGLLVREMDATLTSIREQLLEEVVR